VRLLTQHFESRKGIQVSVFKKRSFLHWRSAQVFVSCQAFFGVVKFL
jgi:hypothetical protein